MNCQYCSREILNKGSLKAHEISCKLNPDSKKHNRSSLAGRQKGCSTWNKGKTYDECYGDKSGEIKNKIGTAAKGKSRVLTDDQRLALSQHMKNVRTGGYQKGSGRGKSGWYKGYWCDSSWELAFLLYHLDHDIDIRRNSERFVYIFENKEYRYIPDFIVNDELIEIKGYWDDKNLAKIDQCPKSVKKIDKSNISPYIDYAISTYGKNFIELYELESNP